MDVQLQELIDKIKKDGVASAEASAAEILADAEKKARAVVSDAEQKAEGIIKNAKAETERMEKASEDAIAQAGRNMILSFRDSLIAELDRIIKTETAKAYSKEPDAEELSVLLSEKDLKELESALTSALKDEIAKGLVLKSDKTLAAGFRIGVKDGRAFYDYSSDSLAELFAAYVNPRTAAILKGAVQGTNE